MSIEGVDDGRGEFDRCRAGEPPGELVAREEGRMPGHGR